MTTPPKLAAETRRVEALVTRRMTRRHRETLDLPGVLSEPLVLGAGVTVAGVLALVELIYNSELSSVCSYAIDEGRPDVNPTTAPAGPGAAKRKRVPEEDILMTPGRRAILRVEREQRRRRLQSKRLR